MHRLAPVAFIISNKHGKILIEKPPEISKKNLRNFKINLRNFTENPGVSVQPGRSEDHQMDLLHHDLLQGQVGLINLHQNQSIQPINKPPLLVVIQPINQHQNQLFTIGRNPISKPTLVVIQPINLQIKTTKLFTTVCKPTLPTTAGLKPTNRPTYLANQKHYG